MKVEKLEDDEQAVRIGDMSYGNCFWLHGELHMKVNGGNSDTCNSVHLSNGSCVRVSRTSLVFPCDTAKVVY